MALNVIQGLMGHGKTYVAVNKVLQEWLVNSDRPIYTNLPCDGLELEFTLRSCTRNVARQERLRQRIIFAKGGTTGCMEEYPDDEGNKRTGQTVSEFWFFAPPNSVVIIDECADVWNALDLKRRPETLQSYINHHRHYKDDIYFVCQSRKDLDVQVRRKIQFLWECKNSLTENMFAWWALRGLRWPVQFFMVKVYSLEAGLDGKVNYSNPLDTYWVKPSGRGYKNYRSFSASGKLPGKRLPAEEAQSSDYDKSLLKSVRTFFGQSYKLFAIVTFAGVAVYLFFSFIYGLLHASDKIAKGKPDQKQKPSITAAGMTTNAPAVVKTVSHESIKTNSVERIVFKSKTFIVTNKAEYRIGDLLAGHVVKQFLADAVLFTDGSFAPYRQLFF